MPDQDTNPYQELTDRINRLQRRTTPVSSFNPASFNAAEIGNSLRELAEIREVFAGSKIDDPELVKVLQARLDNLRTAWTKDYHRAFAGPTSFNGEERSHVRIEELDARIFRPEPPLRLPTQLPRTFEAVDIQLTDFAFR